MAYFIRLRFVFSLVLLAAGLVFAGSTSATAQSKSETVEIFSGFETSAATFRERRVVRRDSARRVVVNRTLFPVVPAEELDGGPNDTPQSTSGNTQRRAGRASTGRSREVTERGVRIINKR